jgi:hypothetical protein
MIAFSCKDCRKRFVGCHSICKEYKEDKERHDALMKKANEGRDANIYSAIHANKRRDKEALAKRKHIRVRRNYG